MAEDTVAPRADRLDMVVMLGEVERRSLEGLAQAFQPAQERGVASEDEESAL